MRALAILIALVPALAVAEPTIVIDPGHGGSDPGGVGTGMEEKVIVLDVSKRFKALLDADTADTAGGGAWSASLTRTTDTFVSLAARSAYSNNKGADRFMSIHANAFSSASANGTETFSFTDTGTGAKLRNLVQEEMIAAWGLTNRGNKTANFAVLRETAAPAILHELAFITNATDAQKLASPDERQLAAAAHLRALQRHFGLAPYVPGEPPVEQGGDIAGHVVDDLGPVAGASVQLEGGAAVVTAADGTFAFTGVAAGAHALIATADGHDDARVDVDVAQHAQADVTIQLARHVDEEPPPDDAPPESSGCATGHDTTALLGLALVGLLVRRRGR